MCYLVAHDKKLPAYEDDGISIRDRLIPKNVTTESLEALGANIILLIYSLNCWTIVMTLDLYHISLI